MRGGVRGRESQTDRPRQRRTARERDRERKGRKKKKRKKWHVPARGGLDAAVLRVRVKHKHPVATLTQLPDRPLPVAG